MSEALSVIDLYQHLKDYMPENDARYVLKYRAGIVYSDLITKADMQVAQDIASKIDADIRQIQSGKPLSKIYGEREFWGLPFDVTEDTLDPRPDTETLIEAVLKKVDHDRPVSILDMGTGTGCILISLLHELPKATGVGIDISESALKTAEQNAKKNDVDSRCVFTRSEWGANVNQSFDIVVSNPPYICSDVIPELQDSVKNYDPILALDGGKDGLQAYKIIFSQLSGLLKPQGKAFFEIGYDQSETVARLSRESRFSVVESYADFAGHIRVLEVSPNDRSGDK